VIATPLLLTATATPAAAAPSGSSISAASAGERAAEGERLAKKLVGRTGA
jgi:hypothetical protein